MSRERVGEFAGYAALIVLGIVAVGASHRYFTGPSDADYMLMTAAGVAFLALVCACAFLIRQPLRIGLGLVGVIVLAAIPMALIDGIDLDFRKIMSGYAVVFDGVGLPLALALVVVGFRLGRPARPNFRRSGAIIAACILAAGAISIVMDAIVQSIGKRALLADYIDTVQVAFWYYLLPIAMAGLLAAAALFVPPRFRNPGDPAHIK